MSDPKDEAVQEFHREAQRLASAYAKEGKGRSGGSFLSDTIVRNADADTLKSIAADIRLHLQMVGQQGQDA